MPTRSHVGWGLGLSLLLHGTGIAALSLALPRVNVRPGVLRQVDFSVLAAPEPAPRPSAREVAAAPVAPEAAASAFAVAATEQPAADVAQPTAPKLAPKPVPTPKAAPKPPLKAATPSKLPSSVRADPRSDGSALERVLRQIAATSELTQDERRKAMLVVLRTWQDPSAQRSAEELIDALLESARERRAPSQPASPKLE